MQLVNITKIPLDRRKVSSNISTNLTPPAYGQWEQWILKYAFQNYGIPEDQYITEVSKAKQSYVAHWTKTFGQTDYTFPSEDGIDFSALNCTFETWLTDRNLTSLIPVFLTAMTGQGYGSVAQMPAFYGLMWNHPNFMEAGMSTHGMLKEGFQTLWERLLAQSAVHLHLSTKIKHIERGKSAVTVTYENLSQEKFDWLIMAAPMPKALTLLADATEEEYFLFGSYNYHELVASILHIDSSEGIVPPSVELLTWVDRLQIQSDFYRMSAVRKGSGSVPKTGGLQHMAPSEALPAEVHLERRVYDSDGDDGPITLRNDHHILDQRQDVMGILQISNPYNSDENLTALTMNEMERYGFQMSLLARERWDYMPWHSKTEVVEERKPWRIWDLQGQRRTWWVGSYVSFESVKDILDYNIKLVNARLCSAGSGTPMI